jgi:hypothetical protein
LPPLHAPALHVSLCVHWLPSLQALPSALLGLEQTPVALSQLPTSWHGPLAEHVTALEPTHFPAAQASTRVQALLSSQAVPSLRGLAEQAPVALSQLPTLHASSRPAQLTLVPATQVSVAGLHFSTPVQASLSSQSASLVH